jgi:single-strand selective monofunctional uracil DNA glycosylase
LILTPAQVNQLELTPNDQPTNFACTTSMTSSTKAASVQKRLIRAAQRLADHVDLISFCDPVTHVYNPLRYAWRAHRAYLERANDQQVSVLYLGMNPGPWGMAQTGVPFGEVAVVRDWLGISTKVDSPPNEHPKRPIEGFQCSRSEVSGRRLWGLFAKRHKSVDEFFRDSLVLNYCPLVFMESTGRNRTPDKLSKTERTALELACDKHLAEALIATRCDVAVGVGAYAEAALAKASALSKHQCKIVRMLHPSPASPAANRDWEGTVTSQLVDAGVW